MKELLSKIEIPSVNIHRIKGEDDPEAEAIRYSREIKAHTPSRDGLPLFDLVMLGLGEDGHTASIFPGSTDLFLSEKICTAVQQPITNQKRITLTGRVINNCDSIFFLVTGKKKAGVVEKMFKKNPAAIEYPASYIVSVYGRLIWFLDKDAGSLL
jgi:6-phosphogluconolactonase